MFGQAANYTIESSAYDTPPKSWGAALPGPLFPEIPHMTRYLNRYVSYPYRPIRDYCKRNKVSVQGLMTWRNNLNKIASTPYSKDEEWIINVEACDDGLVRLGVYETAAHREWEKHAPDFVRKCMFWGREFEGVMADPDLPGCRTEFCTVLSLDIAGIPAVVGAEVDCCDGRTGEYAELKTHSMRPDLPLQKLRKIWVQSYIAGIRHVYVGHRDKYGMVRFIRDLEVAWIPDIVRMRTARPIAPSDRDETWDPAVCMCFMYHCLTWLLEHVSKHRKDSKYFHMHYTPGNSTVALEEGLFSYSTRKKQA